MDIHNQSSNVNLINDVQVVGFDVGFWKALVGAAPSVSSNKLVLNAKSIISIASYKYADVSFALNVPTAPASGDSKKWGLYSPSLGNKSAIFFSIVDDVFSIKVYNDAGTSLFSKTVTFDATWAAAEVLYKIIWNRDVVKFIVAGTCVGEYRTDPTIQHTLNTFSLPLYISNEDSDDLKLGYVQVLNARFASLPSATTQLGGSTIIYNGTAYTKKFAIANIAASQTDSSLVAAVASKSILVLSALVIAGGTATNVTFNTKPAGAGTAITSLKACAANGGFALAHCDSGHFKTTSGEGLSVTTGAGATVGIDITYIEV